MTDNKDRFKFKFFERKTKILHEVREINFVENTIFIVGGGAKFFYDGILIQCTGSKDKNGKLIYEGDIVKCSLSYGDYDDLITKVVYEGDKGYPAFDLSNNQEEFNGISYYINDGEIEIIGNIYKNLELLKK